MSVTQLDHARQDRTNCKSRLTKFKTFLEKLKDEPRENIDPNALKIRLGKIEETWSQYDQAQKTIELLAPTPSREIERSEFEDNYFVYTSLAMKLINECSNQTVTMYNNDNVNQEEVERQRLRIFELETRIRVQHESEIQHLRELATSRATINDNEASTIRSRFPLPKLDLPIFSGGYEEWLGFRDSFTAIIHNDESIPNVQKLRYLRSYLKGNAARVIENIETSEANYGIAWKLLEDRYNNKRIIVVNHMQALIDLQSVIKESAPCLRDLLDTTLKHVRALKVLGQPTESWDVPLICLISAKLDKESRREWERSVKGINVPSFDSFIEFLREKCQILESLHLGINNNNNSNNHGKQIVTQVSKSQANNDRKILGRTLVTTQGNIHCYHCNENHFIQSCEDFVKLPHEQKTEVVKKKGLCFNCLRRGHMIGECKSRNCSICNRRHHTAMHSDSIVQSSLDSNDKKNDSVQVKNCHIKDSSEVILSTAVVDVLDSCEGKHVCRVLLDSGSQPNIITRDLVDRLKLKKSKFNATIEVVNNKEVNSSEWVVATFQSRNSSFSAKLDFLVLPQITGNVPIMPLNKDILKIPKTLNLADPEFDKPSGIDMLIGAELFYDLLHVNRVPLSTPGTSLQSTRLGWIVSGRINDQASRYRFSSNLIRDPLSIQLENFWKLEEFSERRFLSAEEEACEEHFTSNIERLSSGQYQVRLPFNDKLNLLGSSYEAAKKRFFILERKLERNPKLKEDYHRFMRTYEDLNHMELISSVDPEIGYYIPHHCVLKESSLTTKLRVVFDASAQSKSGVSLNEAMMVGPTIQSGIFDLVLRFRQHQFVLTADIEKMYRQFIIHPGDRRYQKILWRYNKNDPLETYQLNTVTYGTAAAPFLATRCLKKLAEDERDSFPIAAAVLEEDFYVDDLATGRDTFEETKQLQMDLIKLTKKAGLNLCQWNSNHSELINDVEEGSKKLDQILGRDPISKTLGLRWNSSEDSLRFNFETKLESFENITKRKILSQVAQLYDPLGLISPIVILAKIQMQLLWKMNVGWDDPLPVESLTLWQTHREQLSLLSEWSIPRSVRVPEAKECQLHGFADASQKAYGACLYLRTSNDHGHQSILLCSKSRVAPVKVISLPRLELCAAKLLVKLYEAIKIALKINFEKIYFWSDSMITLNWINTPPYKLETFEANRVTEIQNSTNPSDWRHVSTKENPADFISRGQLPKDFLVNELWKHGPTWLKLNESDWPDHSIGIDSFKIPAEPKLSILNAKLVSSDQFELWNRYSSLTRLTRIVAYCCRFADRVRKRSVNSGELTSEEMQVSLNRIFQQIQKEEFSKEIDALSKQKIIPNVSKILRLTPIIREGLLRAGGRLENADVENGIKHPILIPKNHPVTNLLVRDTHNELKHAGINATLYAIRENFWIVDGRSVVKKIIHSCVKCCRANPRDIQYTMGNYPKARVTGSYPFEHTGVDYCGHFYIKEKRLRNKQKIKVYVAVFVCLSTKAVHIELVSDLTTDAFIGSLRRFFSRRGQVKALYSDNASNFIGASNELKELHSLLNSNDHNKKIQRTLANRKIEWHFIPARSPHFGGLWEAAVKSLKHHLRRVMGESLLAYEEMTTLLCEIEAILNSRPLTPMSTDPNDLRVLTPGHFLIGKSLQSIPTVDYTDINVNRLSSWQHVQKIKNNLWKRWYNEYLNEINIKNKWYNGQSEDIKVGRLVTVRDDNLPPLRWVLGRIIEVFPGEDNIVRVVKIKTSSGEYMRAVKKLAPLPIDN
ncbi:uncharacterized protein LOC127287411 [Leptopilina boulardi]|uniref:uncharacterized protein LOC127287411 n=1 Tax=Leptopilina boulardi TaxID=63433 RepID=UPI0021F51676|nr:uncharacterized protein LOC127287411 [Leptopilina boulardi]